MGYFQITLMLVEEKGMKSVLNSFNTVLKKSFIGKELWEEAEKIFAQVTLHRIPTFPREQSSKAYIVTYFIVNYR